MEVVRAALEGGADAIQIRDKSSTAYNLSRVTAEIQPLARKFGAALLVNDRVDVALITGADGAHVGQDDLPARDARRLLPRPRLIGVSVGTIEDAKRAQKDGADYVGVGPVFRTATKPDAGEPLGLERLAQIAAAISIPAVAIGGINADNVVRVFEAGALGAAVISHVVSAEDITAAARSLKRLIAGARAAAVARRAPDRYSGRR